VTFRAKWFCFVLTADTDFVTSSFVLVNRLKPNRANIATMIIKNGKT